MDEKSEGAVELRCQASSLSNGSGLRSFISEVGAHIYSLLLLPRCKQDVVLLFRAIFCSCDLPKSKINKSLHTNT